MHQANRRIRWARPLAGLALLGLATLTGCAAGPVQQGGSATSGDVTWWGWTPQPAAAESYIAAFNAEYPNIKVTFKQLTIDGWDAALRPALASDNGPDIFNITPGAKMAQYGGFAIDLAPAMEKALGSDWKSKVAPIGVTGGTDTDGKLAGISAGSVAGGSLWINKALFDQYGLTPPTTFVEWVDVCKSFAAHGVECFVHGAAQAAFDRDHLQSISNQITPGIWTNASRGEAKWTDPAIVKALGIWKDMFSNGIMQKGALGVMQFPDANNEFFAGRAAMIMMGTWNSQYTTVSGITRAISAAGVANPTPFPIVPIPYPSIDGGTPSYAVYGDSDYGLAVNTKSTHQAAATTFAVWLGTSKKGQQLVANVLNNIPALVGVQPQWANIELVNADAQLAAVQELLAAGAQATAPRVGILSGDLVTAIGVAATTVAAGEATPEQAAATLQQAAEASGVVFK
jgi:raffinose/stachyose/melibiose transport system substrate-binding protein